MNVTCCVESEHLRCKSEWGVTREEISYREGAKLRTEWVDSQGMLEIVESPGVTKGCMSVE